MMVTVYTGRYGTDAQEVDANELASTFWLLSLCADEVLDGTRKLSLAMTEFLVSECGFQYGGEAHDVFLAAFEASRPVLTPPPEPPPPAKKKRSRKVKT